MSACLTGCGKSAAGTGILCSDCGQDWLGSPEFNRFHAVPPGPRRDIAVMDFANRIRAERRPA